MIASCWIHKNHSCFLVHFNREADHRRNGNLWAWLLLAAEGVKIFHRWFFFSPCTVMWAPNIGHCSHHFCEGGCAIPHKYWPLPSPLLWGRSRHSSQILAIVLTPFVREVPPFLITMFKFVLYGAIWEILQASDVHYLGVSRFLSRSNRDQVGHLAEVFKESVINILHGVWLSFDTCWFYF